MTMTRISWRLASLAAVLTVAASLCPGTARAQETKPGEWVSLFDGKTLSGWTMIALPNQPKSEWSVVDGALAGTGGASMLYSPKSYTNYKVRAEIKINDKGNSGFYQRWTPEPGFGGGYEAQIDSTHADPIRTGSVYGYVHVFKQWQKPDEWFVYEVEVKDGVWRGKPMTAIKITIDGTELYEFYDFDQTFKSGHLAFQQHDPGSKVFIRKIEIQELPATKK
jgi:hypothetical protein